MSKSIAAELVSALIVGGVAAAHAQSMLLDYAADRVIQKYQTSTCEQLKQARTEGPSLKEKTALEFLRDDERARVAFINKIAPIVAN